MAKSTPKPAAEFKLGACKALIWKNDNTNGPRHNVTFARLFKKEGTWQETKSFGRDDLPLIAKLADRCHDWIFEQTASGSDDAAAHES